MGFFMEDVSPLAALLGALAVIFLLDELLIRRLVVGRAAGADVGQRWFFLHAAANAIICVFGAKDVLTTLANPAGSMAQDLAWSAVPGGFVAGIHTYHALRFKLSGADIFHHAAFAGVGCFSNYVVNYGPLANLYFFFVCGLPGALDYALLGLVKCGRLAAMEEKRLNSAINVWLRAPGLTMVFSFAYAAFRTGDHGINAGVIAVLAFISVHNGQYYLQRVVANYHFKLGLAQGTAAAAAAQAQGTAATPRKKEDAAAGGKAE